MVTLRTDGCQAASKAEFQILWVKIIAFAVYSKNVQETWRWKECAQNKQVNACDSVGVQLVCAHGFPPSTSERGQVAMSTFYIRCLAEILVL